MYLFSKEINEEGKLGELSIDTCIFFVLISERIVPE
jgi:hypothetical protein